jgi:LysR family nitrogen assimilation transcriptional regulator
MDFEQLECFVSVADLGSFSRAALVRRMAQPRLSRSIRSLEVELRQALFHRNGRGVTLTDAGRGFLPHCRGILVQLERARAELEDQRGEPTGQVIVGLPHSIARVLSVPCATSFRTSFPQGMLRITEGLTIHLQEWLLAGRLDIAMLHDPTPTPALETIPLRHEALYLVGSRTRMGSEDPAIPLRQLAELPLIMPGRPHPMRMVVETQLANLGLKPQVVMEVDSIAAIIDMVERDMGFAIVSRNALAGPDRGKRLGGRRIVNPELSSTLMLAYSSERPVSVLARRTLDLLQTVFRRTVLDDAAPVQEPHSS